MKIRSPSPRRHTTSYCRCCTYSVHLFHLLGCCWFYSAALIWGLSKLWIPWDTSVVQDAAGAVGTRAHVMITRTKGREMPIEDGSIRPRHA
jgi:hypothetical protein